MTQLIMIMPFIDTNTILLLNAAICSSLTAAALFYLYHPEVIGSRMQYVNDRVCNNNAFKQMPLFELVILQYGV